MAFQAVANCAEAYIEGLVNATTVGITPKFRHIAGAYTQADIDDLADALDDWFSTEVLPHSPSEASYVNTHVRGLASSLDLEADNNDGAGVGASGGENMPVNVSFVIKFATGLTGRSGRGRVYHWGMAATWLATNENTMDVSVADALVAAWDALDGYISPVGWEHVLVSRYASGAPRVTPLVMAITDYLYTDLQVDTRRKRLP